METVLLHTFIEVVRKGSFAVVAREKETAPSSISRAIASLEQELGLRLFQRSTRKMVLTEAGRLYFEQVESIVDDLEKAKTIASEVDSQPKGRLRVTTPVSFGQTNLVPLLPELSKLYPELSFELLITDSIVDLLAEQIDVAIRFGHLKDSNFVANKLCPLNYVVCASPDYQSQHGMPAKPEAVEEHNCLLFLLPGFQASWKFRNKGGAVVEVPVHGTILIANALSLKACAVNGLGITLLPKILIQAELDAGTLVNLFPDYEVTATNFGSSAWILYPSRSYLPLKTRTFIDFLKSKFSGK